MGTPETNAPVKFTIPREDPDTRIRVFDQEFLVYSPTLRLHSEFFRTFLDSPEKLGSPRRGRYRYDWATLVDDDGTWSLVWSDSLKMTEQERKDNLQSYSGDQRKEETVFKKFLCALFIRPYRIEQFQDLELLTEFADYYRSLPVVSNSLYAALLQDSDFVETIPDNAAEIIPLAIKLRNFALYNDCIIHLLGPWREPRFTLLEDKELKRLVSNAYAKLALKISKTDAKVRLYFYHSAERCRELRDKAETASIKSRFGEFICEPLYYHNLYNCASFDGFLYSTIAPLLKNNLMLDRRGSSTGDNLYDDFFLCAEIEHEDLPWDINKIDW